MWRVCRKENYTSPSWASDSPLRGAPEQPHRNNRPQGAYPGCSEKPQQDLSVLNKQEKAVLHFREMLASGKRIFFDGAMGTMLQARGLAPGQNPEEFCLARPDVLEGIHKEYIQAGADVLTTNTFGGTHFKLPSNLDVRSFNKKMVQAARNAAAGASRPIYIAGSVGPSGKFLRPLGELDFEELVSAFQEQIHGLVAGGADLIIAETQFDIAEARAIVIAARRVSNIPVAVSMTYEAGTTLTGSDVAVCVATLANLGVDLIGMNCSEGPDEMLDAAAVLLRESPAPVLIQPNAGLPLLENSQTVFPLGAEAFAEKTAEFASRGAQAVGGCCGTSPAHIAALKAACRDLPAPGPCPGHEGIVLTSRQSLVRIGRGYPLHIIGERINPTGKKLLTAELQSGEFDLALRFAEEQSSCGAPVLDVNVGAPMVDETQCLPDLVARLSSRVAAPLAIDSSNMDAVEKALQCYPASPLVNSISGEKDRMERLGPLCRDFGAPFILLPLRGKKLPVLATERIAILEDLLTRMDELGIPRRLAIVDALVLAASSSPGAAEQCLEFIRYCREKLELPTVCGLSNISFGLPARELVNASFLCLAAGSGLNACIANPGNSRIREAVDSANLLLGHDAGAEFFVSRYAGWSGGDTQGGTTPPQGTPAVPGRQTLAGAMPESVEEAVIAGKRESITKLVRQALDAGEEPFAIVSERLIPAITEVGRKYERKEFFLPQLIRSAETMQTAFTLLRPLLEEDSRAVSRPCIVMATVEGDIHDIGKNIVNLMLGNHGFEVIDLGKDVAASAIVQAAREKGARLIGLSALMTTTMVRMSETIKLLEKENINAKVMVGGAVVTQEFAHSIGAHYAKDAVDAVRLAKELVSHPHTNSQPAEK